MVAMVEKLEISRRHRPPPPPPPSPPPYSCTTSSGGNSVAMSCPGGGGSSSSISVDNMLNQILDQQQQSFDCKEDPGEKDQGCYSRSISSTSHNHTPIKKCSMELIKEIVTLEAEILHLEQYLLSLYRSAFNQILPHSEDHKLQSRMKSPLSAFRDQLTHEVSLDLSSGDSTHQSSRTDTACDLNDPTMLVKAATPIKDQKNSEPGRRSLAHHFGASMLDRISTPDRLSEEIMRLISSIYCKITGTNLRDDFFSASSPSLCSQSTHSYLESWSSPRFSDEAGKVVSYNKEARIKGVNGPYALMLEVLEVILDKNSFKYAEKVLDKFRSLVQRLEKVDPGKMKREEKLAFWINIHNALVMHAYLAYGSHNRIKCTMKAAYNVGGYSVNADTIRSSILGIQSQNQTPWLQALSSSAKKIKNGSLRHAYTVEYLEPLVHFALCSGAYMDPAVRVYRAKNVFQDLKIAQKEFIQAYVCIEEPTKISLPRVLKHFAKDMSLNMSKLLQIVQGCISETREKATEINMDTRLESSVRWLPYNSTFRYIIHEELENHVFPEF